MGELVYDSQVRAIAEVDYENPYADYLVAGLLPNTGSGTELVDVVSSTGFQNSVDITWNADGSVTPTTGNGVIGDAVATVDANLKDMLFVLDMNRGGNISGLYHDVIRVVGASNDIIAVRTQGWSSGSLMASVLLNNSSSNCSLGGGSLQDRAIWMLHYDNSAGSVQWYKDGVPTGTPLTGRAVDRWAGITKVHLGLPSHLDKFYSSQLYVKDEVSLEDIQAISANPYQVFKTADDVEQEYGLRCSVDKVATSSDTYTDPVNFVFETEVTVHSSAGEYPDFSLELKGSSLLMARIGFVSTGGIRWAATGTSVVHGTWTAGERIRLKVVREGATSTASWVASKIYINDVYAGDMESRNCEDITEIVVGNTDFTAHYVRYSDDSGVVKYWEFNQTRGNYVKCHYTGELLTLEGFPEDSGYVRAWGVNEGLEFDGISNKVTIPTYTFPRFTDGASSGTIEFEAAVTGASNRLGILGTFELRDGSITVAGEVVPCDTYTYAKYRIETESVYQGEEETRLYINDVLITTVAARHDINNSTTLGYAYGYEEGVIGYIHAIDHMYPANSRYYDFTAIRGNSLVVPETINGQDGTMVGFPVGGIYVPEKTKEFLGITTDNIVVPLLSDTAVATIKYTDGTEEVIYDNT